MKNLFTPPRSALVGALSLTALSLAFSNPAEAIVLLNVDLSVANQITVSSTTGASSATISGNGLRGFYLQNLINSTTSASVSSTLVSGNLTSSLDTSDGTPVLFRNGGNDSGLNIYSFTTASTASF